MASRLRCPTCGTIVNGYEGQRPVCPGCGFQGTIATAATPVAAAVAPAVPPAGPSTVVLGAPGDLTHPWPKVALSALAEPPSGPARRKIVHPGIVVLLHIVTLGIYFFVFWWRTSREVDAATGRRAAHPIVRTGLWLALGGVALLLVGGGVVLGQAAQGLAAAEGEPAYGEDQLMEDLRAAGAIVIGLLIVGVLLLVAGRICILVGEYRVWAATAALQESAGVRPRIAPGVFLAVSIVVLVLGDGSTSPGVPGVLADGLGFLALVAYLVVAALTQSHLNRVWQAPPSAAGPPVPPASTPAAASAVASPAQVDWVAGRR